MKRNFLVLALSLWLFIPATLSAASLSSSTEEAAKIVTAQPAIGTLQNAMNDFRNLSRKERKERLKEAKYQIKQFQAEKAAGAAPSTNTLLLVILAILLPPLAVFLHQGEINSKFWIALILTLLFFIPGMIYALITVLS